MMYMCIVISSKFKEWDVSDPSDRVAISPS